jgi:recombination protein RecA
MIFVSREYENPEAMPFSPQHKVGGGRALQFDSSLVCRVSRAAWVKQGEQVIGERHKVEITKTKIGGKDGKTSICYFHTSNGKLIAEGFDRARDMIEAATGMGLIDRGRSGVVWGEHKWRGIDAAVKELTGEPEQMAKLENEIRCYLKIE